MNQRELDRLCWIVASWRDDFYPPNETADRCISGEELDDPGAVGYEEGYHVGMFVAFDEVIDQMYSYGINVLGRANRYIHVHRENGYDLRVSDKPKYVLAPEGCPSVRAHEECVNDVEIESLGETNYEPSW